MLIAERMLLQQYYDIYFFVSELIALVTALKHIIMKFDLCFSADSYKCADTRVYVTDASLVGLFVSEYQ